MSALSTPVLFLIFNRPAETARVFDVIRSQRPSQLFIAADGPDPTRKGEELLVAETREIASRVDWDCEVKTLFRTTHLGCKLAVSRGISWFFEQVDQGIILEDDALPHADFFPYCEKLLARYRDELRVATIGGVHCLPGSVTPSKDHYVSKYFQKGAWATWKRTWLLSETDFISLSPNACADLLQVIHPIVVERGYWMQIYNALKSETLDSWIGQILFGSWRAGANHVMPGRNLVSTIRSGSTTLTPDLSESRSQILTPALLTEDNVHSLTPDPAVDNLIFYVSFLGSLTSTIWLEQVLSPDNQLAAARDELVKRNRLIRQLELEVLEKRRQLLAATDALTRASNVEVSKS